MQDTNQIREVMQNEIILLGPGYAVFDTRNAGCFEIDGRIADNKNNLITIKYTK